MNLAEVITGHAACILVCFLASCFPWWHRCKTLVTRDCFWMLEIYAVI